MHFLRGQRDAVIIEERYNSIYKENSNIRMRFELVEIKNILH